MRRIFTPLAALFLTIVAAQTPGDTLRMYFDAPDDDLVLDSIYPAGCWQVGMPDKPVFTSAFSPGNALVTDTLLPHPENTTCYAEFTLVATDFNYLGRRISWEQWRDMDGNTAGWLEFFDGLGGTGWHRFGQSFDEWYEVGQPPWTDSGYVFTGLSGGWESITAYSPCIGVFWDPGTRTWEEALRVRFAFQAGANPNVRDGWMIDNVRASVEMCMGGFMEQEPIDVHLAPNPAADRVLLRGDGLHGRRLGIQLIRADGAVVHAAEVTYAGPLELDLSRFADGPYHLRVTADGRSSARRIIVQR
ncbi:MAG: hypothetical protein JNM31_02920 [Flavobacteriales bacterium]|nr:hypothetical protein [Flavobacteriales bacterium]